MNRPRALILGLTALWLASCGSKRSPHVVLIVLDTVRADHLSCYGYGRATTPNLDALAARADRYSLARSSAPWTLPSHASLFTGRYPHEHGAEARKSADGQFYDAWPLDESETTLAEVLAQHGYRTAAFAANFAYVNERYKLNQGFATFESEKRRAPEIDAAALAWLERTGADAKNKDAPFFLFLNFMDAHRKYNVAPLAPERASALPAPPSQDVGEMLDELCTAVLDETPPPDPALVQRVIDAYDLGIANIDADLGKFFAELKRRGLFDDALIVVTADHGEYFGEHDLVEHSKDVYEPALRIPLIVKRPGQTTGRVVEEPVSIADVPRLIFDEMPDDVRADSKSFHGSSGDRGLLAELRFTRSKDLAAKYGKRFDRERTVLYSGRWKYIRSSDGADELYDLSVDPHEEHNLVAERPDEARKLSVRAKALTLKRRTYEGDPPLPPLTAEERKTLRELGYADAAAEDEERPKSASAPGGH